MTMYILNFIFQSETAISSHDPNHMSELTIEYSSAIEREKEQKRRYEDLFKFLQTNIKSTQVGFLPHQQVRVEI